MRRVRLSILTMHCMRGRAGGLEKLPFRVRRKGCEVGTPPGRTHLRGRGTRRQLSGRSPTLVGGRGASLQSPRIAALMTVMNDSYAYDVCTSAYMSCNLTAMRRQ
jgi:hypothetical protein